MHDDPRAPRRLYTINETADLMRVSRPTVYKWIREGRVEVCHTPTGAFRIFADSLQSEPVQRTA